MFCQEGWAYGWWLGWGWVGRFGKGDEEVSGATGVIFGTTIETGG